LFNSAIGQKIFAKFGKTDLKISLNISQILLTFIHAMQNVQNFGKFCYDPYQNLAVKLKRFSELNLLARPNFICVHFIHEQNRLFCSNIAVT